jgi:hypothetical protein
MSSEVNGKTALPHFLIPLALNAAGCVDPGIVDQDIEAAEVLGDLDDSRRNLLALSQIERLSLSDSPDLGDLPDNRGDAFPITIQDGDFSSFIGKEMSCRSTHAAGGSGHQRYFSGNGTA